MTTQEQLVYNTYLEVSKKFTNESSRSCKDREEKKECADISKLAEIFSRFPNINIKDFFEAPYFVETEKYFDLKFFTTQKAIKAYTNYEQNYLVQNPDHAQTVQKIKDSYSFIFKFCNAKKIKMDDYILQKDDKEVFHSFLIHLRERKIIIYSLFLFPNFDNILKTYDSDTKNLVFGSLLDNLNFFRTKYYSSSKARNLCIKIFQLLKSKQTNL